MTVIADITGADLPGCDAAFAFAGQAAPDNNRGEAESMADRFQVARRVALLGRMRAVRWSGARI